MTRPPTEGGRITRAARALATLPERRPLLFGVLFVAGCVAIWGLVLLGYFEGKIDFEEQVYGNLPKDLLEGRLAPLRGYATQDWEGGTFPFGFFIVPFFALLQPSLFALKMAGVAFAALASWPWVDLTRRVGGGRAAWAAALLFLLPFPFFLRMILTAFSPPTHMGTVLFSGLALWFLYRGFGDRTLRPGLAALAAGFFLGAGATWAFSIWPICIGVAVAAAILGVRPRYFGLALLGAVPGLVVLFTALLVPIMSRHPGGVWGSIVTWSWPSMISNQPKSPISPLVELWRLFYLHFPHMGGFVRAGDPPSAIRLSPSWIYAVLAEVALGWMLLRAAVARRRGEPLTRFRRWVALCAPVPVYLAVYLASRLYTPEYGGYDRFRYFVPVVPYVFMTVGLAAGELARLRGRLRGTYVVAVLFLLGIGMMSVANVFNPVVFPTPYRLIRGYDVTFLYADLFSQQKADVADKGLAIAGRRDYRELAMTKGVRLGLNPGKEDLVLTGPVPGLPKELWPAFWEGVGAGYRLGLDLALGTRVKIQAPFVPTPPDVDTIPPEHLDYLKKMLARGSRLKRFNFMKGFSRGLDHFGPLSRIDTQKVMLKALEVAKSPLGALLGGKEARRIQRARNMANQAFFEAAGEVLVTVLALDTYAELGHFPEEYGPAVARGLAIGFARKLLPEYPWPRAAPLPFDLGGMERGLWSWVEEERRRLLWIQQTFATRSPAAVAAERARRKHAARGGGDDREAAGGGRRVGGPASSAGAAP